MLSLALEPSGFGAVLGVDDGRSGRRPSPPCWHRCGSRAAAPLQSYSSEWQFLPQRIVAIAPTPPAREAPNGMVAVPGGPFVFEVTGIEIEGENRIGLDVQYPWEDSPRSGHHHLLSMKPFYIDQYPVTNAEFKEFLDATHYHPADDHNFLRDWPAEALRRAKRASR